MTVAALDIESCRAQFPALSRQIGGDPAIFLDGPAGSQVPQRVLDAIGRYLSDWNANEGGAFATSRETGEVLREARKAFADFVGSSDPELICFGQNMTSLTFAVSRSIAKTLSPGDEILSTQLEHDANYTPWALAARDAGATFRVARLRATDCTLDLEDLHAQLNERTRVVALSCASNAVGTIQPIREIIDMAHRVGAIVFLDAVHYAPHVRMAVERWRADFLVCSAYKFFGPHVGALWGRRELLETLPAYKLRTAPDDLPGRWMTGTQSHEGIAGARAAIEYIASLGPNGADEPLDTRTEKLDAAFDAIRAHEQALASRLLAGLRENRSIRVWGIADPERVSERVPTVSITHERHTPERVSRYLAERGIFSWSGNFYALPVTEALGLEPEGMVRIGLLHYNTEDEVDRLLRALEDIDPIDQRTTKDVLRPGEQSTEDHGRLLDIDLATEGGNATEGGEAAITRNSSSGAHSAPVTASGDAAGATSSTATPRPGHDVTSFDFLASELQPLSPLLHDGFSESVLRQAVQAQLETELDKTSDLAAAGRLRELCPVADARVEDYRNRLVEVDPGFHAILGIRFKGLDVSRAFVEVERRSDEIDSIERISSLVAQAALEFEVFRPIWTRAFLSVREEYAIGSLPGAVPDLRLVAGRVHALRATPVRDAPIELEQLTNLDFYEDYVAIYDASSRALTPLQRESVRPQPREVLSEAIEQGTLFAVRVQGKRAGVIGARRGACRGLEGFEMVEQVLVRSCRGRRYAPIAQRLLVDHLPAKASDFLFGTILAGNEPALRTAISVGRVDLGGYWFLRIE